MAREFVMHGVDGEGWRKKWTLSNYLLSEKLDGVRALWVPWTRGKRFGDVSFANKFKDSRYDLICSGFWSRRAKPIFCPDYFVDGLPTDRILDGELFAGRGQFQQTVSTVRKLTPVLDEWQSIRFVVFDSPTPSAFYLPGKIRFGKGDYLTIKGQEGTNFDYNYFSFEHIPHLERGFHQPLPTRQADAIDFIDKRLEEVFALGGEGLMLRHRAELWKPSRCNLLIKIKDCKDDVAVVVDWTPGEGRLEGMMGSLIVLWKGKTFGLSGFSDAERRLEGKWPMFFAKNQVVKFKYRELSDDGVPKEPRYDRPMEDF